MVSELSAPHPRHAILKAWIPPHHVTSGAWTCSAELAGVVNLHGAETSFKWWHYCSWLLMEIIFLQPSITVKGSHLFLMRLISNNSNVSPLVWKVLMLSPLKWIPLRLVLLCVFKHHSSQTFFCLWRLLEFCWWLSSACALTAFCVRHSRWGPTLGAVLMAAIARTMNEFLWCDRKGRNIINKDKEADGWSGWSQSWEDADG